VLGTDKLDPKKFVNLPPDIAKIIVAQRDSWQGFGDDASVQLWKPNESQKQIMLRYPAIRAAIRMTYLPMLAARPVISGGDENQKKLLDQFFRRSYHRIARQLLWRGIGAGYAMGEKLYGPMEIDGKTQWMVNSAIIPPPQDCRFTYAEDMTIKGFIYQGAEIPIEKIVYYIYQGDEVAQPKGVSICEDVFFGWKMLMEDWSRYSVWKDLKAVPALKMYYPEKETRDSGNTVEDPNANLALEKAKEMRNLAVVTLPKSLNAVSGDYVITWDIEEIKNEERNPGFIEAINKDESLIFMGALVPKRIIEQDIKTGALAMVETQKDFFFEVVRAKMHEFEEYLKKTATDPLLMVNYGKVNASFDLDFGDEKMTWYLDTIKEAVKSGMVGLDWEEILTRFNIPHVIGQTEPEIKAEKKTFKGMDFETNRDVKARLDKIAEKWTSQINKNLDPIKEKYYVQVRKDLEEQRGIIGLRIHNLYKSGTPAVEDLATAVQLPSRIFENAWRFLVLAWESGMIQGMDQMNAFAMKQPSKDAENDLYSLDLGWEGFYKGHNEIAGEGEELERRLFFALRNCQTVDEALREFTLAFDKYAEEVLPDRMVFMLHQANQIGLKDSLRELRRRKFEKQAGK
jgi:hypothetical protein